MAAEKMLYTRVETSQLLGISLRAVDKAISDGTLVAKRIGHRVFVSRSSMEAFTCNTAAAL
jgi:hypothetical protein